MHQPTSAFEYNLPDHAIAQIALEPRDASRLLVTSSLGDQTFSDLPQLLDPGDLLVVNTTRVRRARLSTTRIDTGGKVEVLLLAPLGDGRWEVMLRPARRIRPGITLVTGSDDPSRMLRIDVESQPVDGVAIANLEGPGNLDETVGAIGELPLPPYFHGHLDDEERYQTIFAQRVGSAAAPTAALHFTDDVMFRLAERQIIVTGVELEIGLDTFRPMAVDKVADHRIHTERYMVPAAAVDAIAATRDRGGRVVAVGTTVTRTLESAALAGGLVARGAGVSSLFITPGYRLGVVDALLTNFHAPRTTLIALVATVLGDSWRQVYGAALERGYRFLSFGDAMLVDQIDVTARRLA